MFPQMALEGQVLLLTYCCLPVPVVHEHSQAAPIKVIGGIRRRIEGCFRDVSVGFSKFVVPVFGSRVVGLGGFPVPAMRSPGLVVHCDFGVRRDVGDRLDRVEAP